MTRMTNAMHSEIGSSVNIKL